MIDLECLGRMISCEFAAMGMLAEVTFQRIDEGASDPSDDLYHERHEYEKVYHSWTVRAVVDEAPKKNPQGPLGAEITGEVHVFLYNARAVGGSRTGEDYAPQEQDRALWRGEILPVVRVERVLPSGVDKQMAYRIMLRRFS
jgi:hypothetical protein